MKGRTVGKFVHGKPSLELRYHERGLDEIVASKVEYLHFEVMSDQCIWGCIEVAGERIDVWFCSKNGSAHIEYDVTSRSKIKPDRESRTRSKSRPLARRTKS